jgi:hypothetical protein
MENISFFDFASVTNFTLEWSTVLQSWQPIHSLPFPLNLSYVGKCLVSVSLLLVSITKLTFWCQILQKANLQLKIIFTFLKWSAFWGYLPSKFFDNIDHRLLFWAWCFEALFSPVWPNLKWNWVRSTICY